MIPGKCLIPCIVLILDIVYLITSINQSLDYIYYIDMLMRHTHRSFECDDDNKLWEATIQIRTNALVLCKWHVPYTYIIKNVNKSGEMTKEFHMESYKQPRNIFFGNISGK